MQLDVYKVRPYGSHNDSFPFEVCYLQKLSLASYFEANKIPLVWMHIYPPALAKLPV